MPLSIAQIKSLIFALAGFSPLSESEDLVIAMNCPHREQLLPVPPSSSGLNKGEDDVCSRILPAPSCQQSFAGGMSVESMGLSSAL